MTVNTTAKHAAPSTAAPTKRTRTIELDASWAPLLDELADVKLTLSEAKSREKEITDQLKAEAGMNTDQLETLAVRVAGVLRAKISLLGRSGINSKMLKEAFPEAYAACETETEYQRVSPA